MKDLDYHPWDLLGSPRDPEGEPNVVGTHVCVAHPQGVSRSFPNEQIQDCSPRGGGHVGRPGEVHLGAENED